MLVSAAWLKEHLDDQNLVVLDTRPRVAYMYGHIPNSVSLSVEQLIQVNEHGAHLAPDAQSAAQLLGGLGIDQTKTVVVAGEMMDPSVARVAWTLQYLGHKSTMILDVGISTWQSLGNNISRAQKKLPPTQFVPQIQTNLRIDAAELKGLIGKATILDARTPQEYFAGHIPSSILIPFTDGLGQSGFLFDSKESLSSLFAEKQISSEKEIVCYCMHGHRASALFYQLKLAGFERVRLYDGSFIDWHSKRLALE
ncbi:MAG: sulfurtransferase [Nitrososphaerota archaeon]